MNIQIIPISRYAGAGLEYNGLDCCDQGLYESMYTPYITLEFGTSPG